MRFPSVFTHQHIHHLSSKSQPKACTLNPFECSSPVVGLMCLAANPASQTALLFFRRKIMAERERERESEGETQVLNSFTTLLLQLAVSNFAQTLSSKTNSSIIN